MQLAIVLPTGSIQKATIVQIMVLMDCNWMPGADEAVKALEGWENVTAVKNGDVYQIDEDLCSRPNHHVAEACAEWARCIYPDQFNEFNMTLELMAEAA